MRKQKQGFNNSDSNSADYVVEKNKKNHNRRFRQELRRNLRQIKDLKDAEEFDSKIEEGDE